MCSCVWCVLAERGDGRKDEETGLRVRSVDEVRTEECNTAEFDISNETPLFTAAVAVYSIINAKNT